MKDYEIVQKLKEHPEEGISLLEKKYKNLIWYILRGILSGHYEDMEECYQDTLLRSLERIHEFSDAKGEFQVWLTTIARRIAIDRLRQLERKSTYYSGDAIDSMEEKAKDEIGVEEEILQKEKYEQMYRAIEKLRKRDREIFLRKYYYQQSVEQIAIEMSRTQKSIESHLYRIRKKLQGMLEKK